jgi:hypothetical protein
MNPYSKMETPPPASLGGLNRTSVKVPVLSLVGEDAP